MLYYRHKQPDKDEALRRSIEAVMLKHPGYGHKRVADDLQTWQRLWIALLEQFSVFKSMTEHSAELVERALKMALLGADQASAYSQNCCSLESRYRLAGGESNQHFIALNSKIMPNLFGTILDERYKMLPQFPVYGLLLKPRKMTTTSC